MSNGFAERGVQLVKDRLKKMNVSSKPIELYVALAQICKVHGLTPHSSTDRCPFELIKLGNLPSLFPSLTSDTTQKSELTVTRHCANRLKKRKLFNEGDLVVVYDNFTKTNYDAVVSEIVGTNNYIVKSDNGDKHVSGDVMSPRPASSVTLPPPPPADATATVDNIDNNSNIDDDNLSIFSDESEDFELPNANAQPNNHNVNNNNNNHNRRGWRELNQLGPCQNLSRLRSGRR